MSVAIPTTEPTKFTAGDTVQWQKSLPDYPASSWVLSYVLINGVSKKTVAAVASGDDHLISIPAPTSAGYPAGTYSWQAYVTMGAYRVTVGRGSIEVIPNFSGETTFDGRGHVKRTLDAIEAVIENRASLDQEEYTIQGRSLKRTPIGDLLKLRSFYRAEYAREQAAEKVGAGLGGRQKVMVRF